MDINAIWQTVEPYVMAIIGALAGGTGIYALVRSFIGKWVNSFGKKYDMDDMAQKVADKLAGKSLNIDVTAVTEKRLDKIEKALSKQVKAVSETTDSYKHLLALMAGAVSKFKAVTDEERTALTEAIQTIEKGYKPPEPEEIITVSLKPIEIELEGKNEDTDPPLQEEESLINFGGIAKEKGVG